VPPALDTLSFVNYNGKQIAPSYLTHTLAKIVKQAGLERVRFHDLRHIFASLALLQGVMPKVISEPEPPQNFLTNLQDY
jgi:site-specific recombinase XerD